MKLINLLPKTEQKELNLQFFASSLAVFWILILISQLLFYLLTFAGSVYLDRQGTVIQAKIDSEKQVLRSSDIEVLKRQVEELNSRIKVIKGLQAQHYYWAPALEELTDLLPEGLTVNLISLDRQSGKVDISGIAKSRDDVLKFWANMHRSVYFSNINFPLANLNKPVDDPFSFTFYINKDKINQQNF